MSEPAAGAVGRAHGKVILLGEHAVVHGAPALAMAIPSGVLVRAIPAKGDLSLRVPAWDLDARTGDGTPSGEALLGLARAIGLDPEGASLVGETRLPPRAGLGASAAVAAASARALCSLFGLSPSGKTLFAAVQESEKVFHGNPSGLDASAALDGGLLRFTRALGSSPLAAPAPPLVVAHSGSAGDTRAAVSRFAGTLERGGEEGRDRLERIARLVDEGAGALARGDLRGFGGIMDENHEHLAWFGVSTPDLDRLCRTAREAGALGAKLTGGGGGGCAIALVEAGDDRVAARLAESGFEVVIP